MSSSSGALTGPTDMKFLVLLLFICVPLAEIALFIQVGQIIGLMPTIALVILTAVIGVALLKRQGMTALARAQEAVDRGELPVDSVVDGVCLLIAGAFLLTPGLITDTAGFLLLIPAFRRSLARWLFRKLSESGSIEIHGFGQSTTARRPHPAGGTGRPGPGTGPVIEGEFEDVTGGEETGGEPEAGRRPRDPDSPWRP
ncbi:MAG: FxsA family protein [Alphaproteobacteria bacterium]|nr:MAG: FxsA family protein [Alphaproteobacteria bacterium]